MEVHHHPKVEKKKFKEYVLEFIMIFLAVTLGFLAENIRENIAKKEHAELLTARLVKDLQSDTTHLQKSIDFEQTQRRRIDSLFLLLQQPIATADTRSIQRLICGSYAILPFSAATSARSAIEKELNIKQFAASDLPAMMALYESNIARIKQDEDLVIKLGEESLEPFLYTHFTPANTYSLFGRDSLAVDGKMRNLAQNDMTELSIKLEVMGNVLSALIRTEKDLKDQAVTAIQYTIKQYDLTNE